MEVPNESTNFLKNKRDQYVVEIRKKKNEEYINFKRRKFCVMLDQLRSETKQDGESSGPKVL